MYLLRYLAMPPLRWRRSSLKPSIVPQSGRLQGIVVDALDQVELDLTGQQLARNLEQSLGRLSLLPPELVVQVLSYVVVAPCNVHVIAPCMVHVNAPEHNTSKSGWRLSLCPNNNWWGPCDCRPEWPGCGIVTKYMDTALLLVSRAMRETTLDVMFARNLFVISGMSNLVDSTAQRPTAAARIRSMRLDHRVDDYGCWDFQAKTMAGTRALLKSLRRLKLTLMVTTNPACESLHEHEDDLAAELCQLVSPLFAGLRYTWRCEWYMSDLIVEMQGFDGPSFFTALH